MSLKALHKKCFSFKRIEKSIASFFLDNPLARAGDEGGVLSPLTNFWTDNFSWDYGRSKNSSKVC